MAISSLYNIPPTRQHPTYPSYVLNHVRRTYLLSLLALTQTHSHTHTHCKPTLPILSAKLTWIFIITRNSMQAAHNSPLRLFINEKSHLSTMAGAVAQTLIYLFPVICFFKTQVTLFHQMQLFLPFYNPRIRKSDLWSVKCENRRPLSNACSFSHIISKSSIWYLPLL